MSAILGLLCLIVIMAAAAFWVVRYTEEPMDDMRRTEAPGQFATLSHGVTHYQLDGPKGAPLMVLVHGLTTPSFVFDALVPGLHQAGFRVLRYDLYGRGYSDRPDMPNAAHLFVQQLEELLAHLGEITTPITLTGYSMGGAIAVAFTVRSPARVRWLVLLAPGGMGHSLGPFLETVTRLGPLGDWLMATFGGAVLRRTFSQDYETVLVPHFHSRLMQEPGRTGYLRSVLSSMRDFLEKDQSAAHQAIAAARIPTLAIWGAEDPVIPAQARHALQKAHPEARHVVLEEADHDLPHKCPTRVLEAMLDRESDTSPR